MNNFIIRIYLKVGISLAFPHLELCLLALVSSIPVHQRHINSVLLTSTDTKHLQWGI